MDEVRREAPAIDQKPYLFEPLDEFDLTVRQFLKVTSTRPYRLKATGYIDNDLFELFWQSPSRRNLARRRRDYVLADNFVRKHKRNIVAQVSRWTGVADQVVKDLLDKCSARARALDLWVRKDQRDKQLVELTSYVSYRCALYALNDKYLNGAHGRQ